MIKLSIWDTAGQEKFKSLTRMYFQDAEAALIVYDVTFRPSFENAKTWVQDLKDNANK
jgi:small GTP-binding protein